MADWEITLNPDEVEQIIKEYARDKYGLPENVEFEPLNEWPHVVMKMGEYQISGEGEIE